MPGQRDSRVEWLLWLQWVVASAIGWAAGFAIVDALGSPAAVGFAEAGAVAGAVVGMSQWFILRQRIRRAAWWVVASLPGWALGWGVLAAGSRVLEGATAGDEIVDMVIAFSIVGAVVGLAQALVLWRSVRQAGWWVAASSAGWAAGWALHMIMGLFSRAEGVAFGLVGAVSGAITGLALTRLLRRPLPDGSG